MPDMACDTNSPLAVIRCAILYLLIDLAVFIASTDFADCDERTWERTMDYSVTADKLRKLRGPLRVN